MGEEALGLVKVLCPNIGECQVQEVGVDGFRRRGRKRRGYGIFKEETKKGDSIWNVNKENI
jgi:hypothetical protein